MNKNVILVITNVIIDLGFPYLHKHKKAQMKWKKATTIKHNLISQLYIKWR